MAHVAEPHRSRDLGPGFWQVTIGLTIFNIVTGYLIATMDIAKYLPVAAIPAGSIDDLFRFMSVIGNALFVYVCGYLVYFCIVWRHRATDPPDALGIQVEDNHLLELWWTIVPIILVAAVGAYAVSIWWGLQTSPANAMTVEAVGHQFKFEFRYPKLKDSVYDQLNVPVDTNVTVEITSADVLHSFWVPSVRMKLDMVPGLVQSMRFTPTRIGTYRIACAEFCGANHAHMHGTFVVQSKADFSRWLAATAKSQSAMGGAINLAAGTAAAGQALFSQKCTACHALGTFSDKIVGPGLKGLAADPAHPYLVTGKPVSGPDIEYVIVNGYHGLDQSNHQGLPSIGTMPTREANGLSNTDIANLVAYLLSLSKEK
ncbi:MAG: cytochrome c oxidase subunit II [Vulcanimicrobiaceae bacterium]